MTGFSKIFGTCAVSIMALSTAAQAQDRFEHDWEGFYVGAFVAGSFFDVELSDLTDTFTNDAPAINEIVAAGGINAGYNWIPRDDNLMLGVELEIQGGHTTSNLVRFNSDGTDGQLFENTINSITSLKGRVGMMNDNLMVYISGGPAWASIDYTATDLDPNLNSTCDTNGIICAEASEDLLGLNVGVGMEYAIRESTTLRFEITQIELPTASAPVLNGGDTPQCSVASADDCTGFFGSSMTQIQFGVNYRF